MSEHKSVSLDELLAQKAEYILSHVLRLLVEQGGSNYQKLPIQLLEMRVQRLFDAFWQGMAQHDAQPLIDYIRITSRDRGNEGFSVDELQTVGLCLRDTLLGVVDEAYADDAALRLRYSRQIEELILMGIGSSVRGFVDGREALISRQYNALRRTKSQSLRLSGRSKSDTDMPQ